jgi:hypothetical protein
MHAARTNREHDVRIQGREEQNRSWAAPIPVPPKFEIRDGTRQRMEWDTRETINNRLWSDTMTAGPKMVMSAMLAAHPTRGAETMNPVTSRDDHRPYRDPEPVSSEILLIREPIKESNRNRIEDVAARMAGRTFEHQWLPDTLTREIAERKIEASELLRPSQDDFRRNYLPYSNDTVTGAS